MMKLMNETDPSRDTVPDRFQYDLWRGQFINLVLRVISALGLLLLLVIVPASTIPETIVFSLAYILLLVVTFSRFSNRIKASVVPIVGFLLGLYTLFNYGPWSDATLLFLSSIVFAALLFEKRIDRIFLVFSVGAVVLVGLLNLTGLFNITSPNLPPPGLQTWAVYSAGFMVMSVGTSWAIYLLKQEFKTVANQYQSTLELLTRDKTELEQRVEERTTGLTKKTEQLRAASYIARQTAEARELESITQTVVDLITDRFRFYHAGIFLINEAGDRAVLQAASSEGGKQMVENGYSLEGGSQDTIGYVLAQKKPRIALDIGADAISFSNPDLPKTRSEIALPLIVQNNLQGVLDIQSDQPGAFHIDDIDVFQTLADQVAVAIENARLLDEAQTALIQLEAVTSQNTRQTWLRKLQEQTRTFTFTPLGLHAGSPTDTSTSDEGKLKASISLRGQKIGNIVLSRKDNSNWSKLDEDLINEVAYQVGLAVDNLRLLEDAQSRARQEQTIGELATRFSQALDIDSLLQTASRELGQLPDVSEVSVFIGQLPEQAPQRRRSRRVP